MYDISNSYEIELFYINFEERMSYKDVLFVFQTTGKNNLTFSMNFETIKSD